MYKSENAESANWLYLVIYIYIKCINMMIHMCLIMFIVTWFILWTNLIDNIRDVWKITWLGLAPVLGLARRQVSLGAPADDPKVKFPVVICPVFTVYFLTYMLLCVPSSVLFQKSCYFVRFRRTCLRGCLRPILEAWGLSVFDRFFFVCFLFFLPITFNFYPPHFPNVPHSPNKSLYFLSS